MDPKRLLRQSAVAAAQIGPGQTRRVKWIAGKISVFQPGGLQNGLLHIFIEVHARDRLHHQLGQRKAVVAVDAERSGGRLEGLGAQPLQQRIGGRSSGSLKRTPLVKVEPIRPEE